MCLRSNHYILEIPIINHDYEKAKIDTSSTEKTRMKTQVHQNKLPARLLSVSEVADFLGVHTSTVRRWAKKGLVNSYTIGIRNNLRFKQEDVLNFLHECQKTTLKISPGCDPGTKRGVTTAGQEGGHYSARREKPE